MHFCKDRRFDIYYASDIGLKRTNDKFRCWGILIPAKCILYENVYNSGTLV